MHRYLKAFFSRKNQIRKKESIESLKLPLLYPTEMMEITADRPPPLLGPDQAAIPEDDCIKPRPYQEVMRDICIKQNTIIYLPTGAGKTYIALMVIKHFAKGLEK